MCEFNGKLKMKIKSSPLTRDSGGGLHLLGLGNGTENMHVASPVSNAWTNMSGISTRMGTGGSDFLQSTNNLPNEFYKLEVKLP